MGLQRIVRFSKISDSYSWWSIYVLCFAIYSCVEKTMKLGVFPDVHTCESFIEPFFATNHIRIIFLLIPAFILGLAQYRQNRQAVTGTIPVLLLGIYPLAYFPADLIYLLFFLFLTFFFKRIQVLSIFVLTFFTLNIALLIFIFPDIFYNCKSQRQMVKVNMYTLSQMLELYRNTHSSYPKNIKKLQKDALAQNYWKEPYTRENPEHVYADISEKKLKEILNGQRPIVFDRKNYTDILGVRIYFNVTTSNHYRVFYYRNGNQNYTIYGMSKDQIILDRGIPFVLTNSE